MKRGSDAKRLDRQAATRKGFAMKKVAIGGALVGLAFIIAGAFWLAYRNSAENDIPADETFVQSPVVKIDKTERATTPDAPAEKPENAEEIARNEETATSAKAAAGTASGEISNLIPPGCERYGRIAYTRQGNPYRINPDWDTTTRKVDSKSLKAARATPTGPPLSIDWTQATGGSKMIAPFEIDWRDPRTWESYRNFWGFEPPIGSGDGTRPYEARLDNWGKPFQHFGNLPTVMNYGKRTGFRPSPEQLDRFLNLEANWIRARRDSAASRAALLRQEMQTLMVSAQGELPVTHGSRITSFPSPSLPPGPEGTRERVALAIRNLYRRLGIEHLYDFYENPEFRLSRNRAERP